MLEIIDKIQDSKIKKEYLIKLKENLKEKPESSSSHTSQMYNIKDIIFQKYNDKPKEVTIQDLQKEINPVKKEIKQLKLNQEKDREQLKQIIKSKMISYQTQTQIMIPKKNLKNFY